MEKALYIAGTSFQLINILNIKYNMNSLPGDLAIDVNNIPNSKHIKEIIKKYELFENIYLIEGHNNRISNVFSGKKSISKYFRLLIQKYILKSRNINEYILDGEHLDIEKYTEGYAFSKNYCNLLFQNKIAINIFDEGFGSYIKKSIPYISNAKNIYLYRPKYSDYYAEYINKIIEIPNLSKTDIFFRNMLNDIFGYKDVNIKNGDIIFFDQPYAILSDNFKRIILMFPVLKKIKKYENRIYTDNINQFMMKVIEKLSKWGNFVVKPHPRISAKQLEFYKNNSIRTLANNGIPWEVILLNNLDKNIKLVSFNSTATLSPFYYFDSQCCLCKSFFLYKIFFDEYNVSKVLVNREIRNMILLTNVEGINVINKLYELYNN